MNKQTKRVTKPKRGEKQIISKNWIKRHDGRPTVCVLRREPRSIWGTPKLGEMNQIFTFNFEISARDSRTVAADAFLRQLHNAGAHRLTQFNFKFVFRGQFHETLCFFFPPSLSFSSLSMLLLLSAQYFLFRLGWRSGVGPSASNQDGSHNNQRLSVVSMRAPMLPCCLQFAFEHTPTVTPRHTHTRTHSQTLFLSFCFSFFFCFSSFVFLFLFFFLYLFLLFLLFFLNDYSNRCLYLSFL